MKHKEYLDSESDYMHVVFPDFPTIPKRYIEIPEGAEVLTKYNDEIIFWKENKYSFHTTNSARWDDADDGLCTLSEYKQRYNSTILWQRHPENQEPLDGVKWLEGDLKEADAVNQPNHYANFSIECIDAMQAMLSKDEFIGYLRGNIFKYNWRYKLKNGIEDLKKAQWYQAKLIEVEENE